MGPTRGQPCPAPDCAERPDRSSVHESRECTFELMQLPSPTSTDRTDSSTLRGPRAAQDTSQWVFPQVRRTQRHYYDI